MVVYHEQAKLVYGLISIGFVILTGILAKFSFGKRKFNNIAHSLSSNPNDIENKKTN